MAKKQKKKTKIKYRSVLTLIAVLASLFLIYHILLLGPIEPVLRYIAIAIILLIDFYFIRKNNSNKNKALYIVLSFFFIIINIGAGLGVNKVYSLIDNLNKSKIVYSTSLITKAGNDIVDLDVVVNKNIRILEDTTSIDNYILANEIIEDNDIKEDNEIVKYDDLTGMVHDLYNGKVDLIFISSNYTTMFQEMEGYQNIEQDTKVITTSEKEVKKEDSVSEFVQSDGKNITKPFTVLLMGVDSEKDGLIKNASNGDSLILISFNPTTLNATMLSIPRDSYVPISCFKDNRKSKITHAGWYGASCMINTIQDFLDVKIDYYFKINFKGVVSLVDTLGGVTVEVPRDLCTDNSSRDGKVCIQKGVQTLNGEEALVLARNRYDLPGGDFDRANNQQLLLKALLNQVKTINSISQITEILTTISNNIDTNMTTNQILSLYNVLKDILKAGRNSGDNVIPIQKLALSGQGKMLYDSYAKLNLWNYILNEQSIQAVSEAINNNLGTGELTKTFNYSINDEYVAKVVGTPPYKEIDDDVLLPSFVGEKVSVVEEFAKKYGIEVEYNYEVKENVPYEEGEIFYQNYLKNTKLNKVGTLKVSVLKKKESTSDKEDEEEISQEAKDCSDAKNTDKSCYLPSLIGKTKKEVEEYFNTYNKNVKIIYNEVNPSLYPGKRIGTVVSQNYKVSTHLSKIQTIELTIIEE